MISYFELTNMIAGLKEVELLLNGLCFLHLQGFELEIYKRGQTT